MRMRLKSQITNFKSQKYEQPKALNQEQKCSKYEIAMKRL